jgi:hypothetical protein
MVVTLGRREDARRCDDYTGALLHQTEVKNRVPAGA